MNPLVSTKCARLVLVALAAMASILLTVGCGSSGSPVPVKGGFSNASLKGFIALNGTNVEDGTVDQQSGTFTNTSLGTQAAFFMDGFDWVNGLFKDRVGTLVPSGTDSLGTNYVTSFFAFNTLVGGSNPNAFSGTYSVASNGRTTTQLS